MKYDINLIGPLLHKGEWGWEIYNNVVRDYFWVSHDLTFISRIGYPNLSSNYLSTYAADQLRPMISAYFSNLVLSE